ncbi:MAG: hypothetical protein H7Y01_07705 [Ferruginibacter sp.]|nr:hypothetical protein [Chitinophagaceae bacterium]
MKKQPFATLSLAEIAQIKRVEIERFRKIDSGLLEHRFFLRPVTVKILILVDDGISFNQFYFGLSEVLDTLNNNPEWWVNFEITKAHRSSDPNKPPPGPAFDLYGPDHESFRFTQAGFNMNDYDQLWLYGFRSGVSFPASLNDNELEIVYRWMNEKQGGILAMGDHASLGEALCSRIPRVRNMRKWRFDASGTDPDSAPSNTGANRHDTLVKGHDYSGTGGINEANQYTFDDESDDIPMSIRLRWYYSFSWPHFTPVHWYWPYRFRKHPHPVLCGKNGAIKILPDHPHEGEVIVPSDLTLQPSFNTYQFDEYPSTGTSRISPEIIAWASVQDDHTAADFKGVVNSKEFGAIGAYNGHTVNVGRVIVDSTWHHWFDVNLTGRMNFNSDIPVPPGPPNLDNTGDPHKLNGFNDTAAGIAALNKIRNYYRNVAIWLSPPDKIDRMNLVLLWNSIFRYPLYADLTPFMPAWVLGHHAIDVLGKYAGSCNVRGIWWPLVKQVKMATLFDPKKLLVPVDLLQQLDEFMIGGILKVMLQERENVLQKDEKQPDIGKLSKMAEEGLQKGLNELREFVAEKEITEKNLFSFLNSIEAGGKGNPKENK